MLSEGAMMYCPLPVRLVPFVSVGGSVLRPVHEAVVTGFELALSANVDIRLADGWALTDAVGEARCVAKDAGRCCSDDFWASLLGVAGNQQWRLMLKDISTMDQEGVYGADQITVLTANYPSIDPEAIEALVTDQF
jgi:hypothetical protein